jgi:Spy/CpxP family protein refolding chaperone
LGFANAFLAHQRFPDNTPKLNMKPLIHLFVAAIITLRAGADPMADQLFPPELIQRARGEITLTDQQQQHIQTESEKMGVRFRELQERLQAETDALTALVKPGQVDAPAALAQLDKVLDAEREMKRAQIGFMIAIKNQLTPEQQTKLASFRKAHGLDRAPMEELHRRLMAKSERVRLAVEKLVSGGGDPSPIAAIMNEVGPLMEQGKHK